MAGGVLRNAKMEPLRRGASWRASLYRDWAEKTAKGWSRAGPDQDLYFRPSRGGSEMLPALLVAAQTMCRAPRPLLARTSISSTAKPARPRRPANAAFGAADHMASKPPGRSALRAASRPREL